MVQNYRKSCGSGAGPIDAAFDCMKNILNDQFSLQDFALTL